MDNDHYIKIYMMVIVVTLAIAAIGGTIAEMSGALRSAKKGKKAKKKRNPEFPVLDDDDRPRQVVIVQPQRRIRDEY